MNHFAESQIKSLIMYVDALQEAKRLEEMIATDYNCLEIFITILVP